MKKILCLLVLLLALAGCQTGQQSETVSGPEPTTSAPTESLPTLLEQGNPWDEGGVLTELPLSVPQGWHCGHSVEMDGDLLIWGVDDHRSDYVVFQLSLMDPLTGQVLAQTEVSVPNYTTPHVLGDRVSFCDSYSGQVLVLDRNLEIAGAWTLEPDAGFWIMGQGDTLYQFSDAQLNARNLTTGAVTPVIENAEDVYSAGEKGGQLQLEYYQMYTGALTFGNLDLATGEVGELPFSGNFSNASRVGETWLCRLRDDSQIFYLGDGNQVLRATSQDGSLSLLPEGYLLEASYDSRVLTLYRTDGEFVSRCEPSQTGSYYLVEDLIWSEELEGYFLHIQSYNGDNRLLFWDIRQNTQGQNLVLEEVPPLSEALSQLREQADGLEAAYGVTIWIGEECQTEFYDFSAQCITDWEEIHRELESLELALSSYPEGFFRQIRDDYTRGIQIHLVQNLQATQGERVGGSYSAFTQYMGDYFLIVSDILVTNENSYYHEFSHVIDRYLESKSWQREDALFSEDGWMALNPDGFEYSYNYAADCSWFDYPYHTNWFIDTYATISPTEDRARVMEYAMGPYNEWWFQGNTGLLDKLDYYARCIRDTFDTTGWPEITQWEQYLYLRDS